MAEWFLGGLFIAIHAYSRYSTPKANRYTTTYFQFYTFLGLYVGTLIVIYVIVGVFLKTNEEFVSKLLGLLPMFGVVIAPETLTTLGKGVEVPILVALGLTVLLPSIPGLAKFDGAIRDKIWFWGNIPFEARQLAIRMLRTPYLFTEEMKAQVGKLCESRGLKPDDLQFNRKDGVSFFWAKSAALVIHIKNLKRDRRGKKYEEFLQANGRELEKIYDLFEEITPLAKNYFKAKHDLSLKEDRTKEDLELLNSKREIFNLNNEIFMNEVCHFVARAVLYSEVTEKGRIKKIASMGFGNGNVILSMLTGGQFVVLTFVISISFICIAVFETLVKARQQDFEPSFFFPALLMTSIYISAVFAALIPKAVWKFENDKNTQERPIPAYLASGFLAVIFGAALSFFLRYLKNVLTPLAKDIKLPSGEILPADQFVTSMQNKQLVLMDLGWSHPYFLQSFVIAITIAFLADSYSRRNSEAPKNARWMDSALTALLLAITSAVTFFWMEGISSNGDIIFKGTRDVSHKDQWDLWAFILKGAVVGFLIGAFVPNWFRANRAITPMEKVRTMLLSHQTQRSVLHECMMVKNDVGIEKAFNDGTAFMVWSDGNVDEREIDKLEEFWEKFSYVIGEHFKRESFRDNFYESLKNIQKYKFPAETPELNELSLLRNKKYLSSLMVLLCTSIMNADGRDDPNEIKALDILIEKLEFDPA